MKGWSLKIQDNNKAFVRNNDNQKEYKIILSKTGGVIVLFSCDEGIDLIPNGFKEFVRKQL